MKAIGLFLALIQFTWISNAYFRGPSTGSFEQAKAYCEDQGTTLATIQTESDYERAYRAADGGDCYIGLQDHANGDAEGVWSWTDGTDIASDYGFNSDRTATTGQGPWNSGEPNNSGDEDCVELRSSGYNDIGCTDPNYPLCNGEYFRGPDELTFEDAVEYCESEQAVLASIPTEEDYNLAVLACGGKNCYIGLQDEINGNNDMIWSWTDGTDTASNYGFNSDRTATTGSGPWNSGEPNEHNGNDEDCVEMYTSGKYNDCGCDDKNYPLCKALATAYPTTAEPTVEPTPTPKYFVGPSEISYDAAIQFCEDMGAIIASIPTEEDYEEAVEIADGKEVWVGLRDEFNGDGDMYWSWTDGTAIESNYGFNSDRTATTGSKPWNSGEPNEHQGSDEDCVEMYNNGRYNDISCSDDNYPLCNREKFFIGASQVSFDEAVEYCEGLGGVLVSAPTEAAFDAVVAAADGRNVWIGLQDQVYGNGEGIWSWTDGTDIASTYGFNADGTATTGSGPWYSGEPNNLNDEDCVELYSDGLYNDIDCSDNNYPLCMLYARDPTPYPTTDPTTSDPTTAAPTTDEPTTAEPTKQPIYWVGGEEVTFEEAVAFCEEEGGLLASIPTEEDWEEAVEIAGGLEVWIGLQDEINYDNDMIWSWTDGTDIASNFGFNSDRSATTGQGPWNSGEPNEHEGNDEDCVEMYTSGKYNDISCDDTNYPLCKEKYFMGPSEVTFYVARSYCEEQGGVLAIIPTENDYEAAVRVAQGNEVWVGLRDDIRGTADMIWYWIDGTDTASTYGFNSDQTATTGEGPWESGEPNEYQGTDEDCVEIYSNGKYNDIPCKDDKNYPLCMVLPAEPCYAEVCSEAELDAYCASNAKVVGTPSFTNDGFGNEEFFVEYMNAFQKSFDENMMGYMMLFTFFNVLIGVTSCYINAKMCKKTYSKIEHYDITTDEESLKS